MTGVTAGDQLRHVKRALCIADFETTSLVNESVDLLGWRLDTVETEQEAINSLRHDTYEAIIVAVSTARFNLFDSAVLTDEKSNRVMYTSRLLQQTMSKWPSTFRVIYGLEAVEFPDIREACFDCGADAAVNSSDALFRALFGLITPPPEEAPSADEGLNHSQRQEQLLESAGGHMTRRLENMMNHQLDLKQSTQEITGVMRPRTLAGNHVPNTMQTKTTKTNASSDMPCVRIVHVSDTKNMHRNLVLPEGDLFLHTGNFTDGDKTTCLDQFQDFLLWIHEEVLTKFRQVVFVPGNQEFFLDIIACQYNAVSRHAQKILNHFLSCHRNVAFLENTGITFNGLRIHGSSMVWKKEDATKTKTTKYGAFERPYKPDLNLATNEVECDILVTHRPPSCWFADCYYQLPSDYMYGVVCPNEVGAAAAEQQKSKSRGLFRRAKPPSVAKTTVKKVAVNPPRLHAFGHYAKDVGIDEYRSGTLLLNGSQERVLKEDKYGGGIPIVVDLPLTKPRVK